LKDFAATEHKPSALFSAGAGFSAFADSAETIQYRLLAYDAEPDTGG
jgi:hypothetical protein